MKQLIQLITNQKWMQRTYASFIDAQESGNIAVHSWMSSHVHVHRILCQD
jgi:uncharacterized protein YkwD